ncbi:unnamed protein product [Larinioides sclopetarius]|uniref:Uncharacterized protein n=1 Tax=Larinioides sclopetarius TaxID=280406 RepID=A0AAV1YZ60_9ARAC
MCNYQRKTERLKHLRKLISNKRFLYKTERSSAEPGSIV